MPAYVVVIGTGRAPNVAELSAAIEGEGRRRVLGYHDDITDETRRPVDAVPVPDRGMTMVTVDTDGAEQGFECYMSAADADGTFGFGESLAQHLELRDGGPDQRVVEWVRSGGYAFHLVFQGPEDARQAVRDCASELAKALDALVLDEPLDVLLSADGTRLTA